MISTLILLVARVIIKGICRLPFVFKNLDLTMRNMTLHVEERLLLKLLQFLGYVKQDDDIASTIEEDDESLYDNQR